MNKYKKLAIAAVSMVMAGSMAFSLAACGPKADNPTPDNPNPPHHDSGGENYPQPEVKPNLDADGKLSWDATTQIRLNMGYNSATTGIAFDSTTLPFAEAQASATLPDGKSYTKSALKPFMAELEKQMQVDVVNAYQNRPTSDNLGQSKTEGLDKYDAITADVSKIVDEATNDTLLDFGPYLRYMPNFRHFIESNSLIQLSVIGDVDTGSIYYAPYFDGNNDIERYVLFRKDYVTQLLDHATDFSGTITYKAQAAAKTVVAGGAVSADGSKSTLESYMGKTGNYKVATSDPKDAANNYAKTGFVMVDYDAVISALKDSGSELAKAVAAGLGAGKTAQTTSGNIVDIQNDMINQTGGEVAGEHLLKVLKEYIKVAYKYSDTENGTYTQLYGAKVGSVDTKLSDVFNSAFGAWDVDLYVGMARAFVTCSNLLGEDQGGEHAKNMYAWLPRQEALNRTTMYYAFAQQLYGIRGLESRYGQAYIDASGNMRDARYNKATWEALDKFSGFIKEGLIYSTIGNTAAGQAIGSTVGSSSCSTNSYYDGNDTHLQSLSSYDYVQTQTAAGYMLIDGVDIKDKDVSHKEYVTTHVKTEDGYNFAPVVTPVSRYNTDDKSTMSGLAINSSYDSLDQNKTIMRFTESWRSVKSAGICIPANVKSDSKKLAAILGFIDYLYSNDGRIIGTFGPMANDNSYDKSAKTSNCGGFWYGNPVTGNVAGASATDMAALADKGVVETYDGKQYTVTAAYQGQYFVYGNKLYTGTYYNGAMVPIVTDAMLDSYYGKTVNGMTVTSSIGSYTSYAQQVLGTCLGFAEKMQAFEFQLTAPMGINGATIVGYALGNGTIKHVQMAIDPNNYWYTVSPTGLPLSSTATTEIAKYTTFTNLFATGSKLYNNLFLEVMTKGLANATATAIESSATQAISDKDKMVTAIKGWAAQYENFYNAGWQDLLSYYTENMAG